MASGIAHDINNALSPASIYVQMMLRQEPNLRAESRDYLTIIQRAIDDVAHTVARMKEFYRQREPELLLAPVDLNALATQVIDLTRARWSDIPEERGAVIHFANDLRDVPAVLGVESDLRDVLTNLVLNAIDAMPDGGVLGISTRVSDAGNVTLEVSDTGVGMDDATRTRCLEPFFTTKGERGSGLGLAMVYGTIQRHGGVLDIESEPGRGTTVRLTLPIPAAPVASATADVVEDAPRESLRLLVVDDDPIILKSLGDVLRQDGHVVVTADGGQRGIDAFRHAEEARAPFAVVITDLGMPHVDGRTVATAAKALRPSVAVILLTGWGHRIVAEDDIPKHVDRVLSKPPNLAQLRLTLATLVHGTDV
jgi:CheY-like chemotaxis protein